MSDEDVYTVIKTNRYSGIQKHSSSTSDRMTKIPHNYANESNFNKT